MTATTQSGRKTLAAVDPAKAAGSGAAASGCNAEQRQTMIAEAAYFHAEKRGFAPGDELLDWLAAEAEVSAQLDPAPSPQRLPQPPAEAVA